MKPKFKDYYGDYLKNGIYFIADKSESGFCKIILDKIERNFSVVYPNVYVGSIKDSKSFVKKLIPFKGTKQNLEWVILNLKKEI